MSHQDVIPYLQKAGVIRHNFTLKKDRSALFLKPDERALNDLVKALTNTGGSGNGGGAAAMTPAAAEEEVIRQLREKIKGVEFPDSLGKNPRVMSWSEYATNVLGE